MIRHHLPIALIVALVFLLMNLGRAEESFAFTIGYTELRTDLGEARHANISTSRAMAVRADGTGKHELGAELIADTNTWTQFAGWSPDGATAIIGCGWQDPDNARWEEENRTFRMEPGKWRYDGWLLDMRTNRLTDVTAVDRVSHYNGVSFAHDGKKLLMTSLVSGTSKPFLMNLDGSDKQDVSGGSDGFTYGFHASPDGKRICYHENYQVFLADANGSNKRKIETGNPFNFAPVWSPDGRRVLFVSGEHYDCHPHIVRADGSGLTKLADRQGYRGVTEFLDVADFHGGSSDTPVWSADGQLVYYTAKVSNAIELYQVDLEGRSKRLTRSADGVTYYHPKPSADGKWLLYGSKRNGVRQLFVRDLSTGNERQITQLELGHAAMWAHWRPRTEPWKPVIEVEEDVYAYQAANNGAGPMWCAGSTSMVRIDDRVFATTHETLSDAQPLNNCRWTLMERTEQGWRHVLRDQGRTREPAPLACFHNGSVIVSGNPTLSHDPEPGGGPARPELWHWSPAKVQSERWLPEWHETPQFREHSYRSLAADGAKNELILLQNIGYAHAEWAFRDADGTWSAQGRLQWPWGESYETPKPVRLCYPNVAIRNRAVHFFGVEDVTEPVEAWRLHKERLTGNKWDYVFRKLYYSWTPDITSKPFHSWIEIVNLEKTSGHVWPCDLWLAPNGEVHLLWTERAIDERLRETFFPEAQQAHRLCYAVLRDGSILRRHYLLESTEAQPGPIAHRARFHVTPENRLYVVSYETSPTGSENPLRELDPDTGLQIRQTTLALKHPFTNFFTATQRAGCRPSDYLDLLGTRQGRPMAIGYARVCWEVPARDTAF